MARRWKLAGALALALAVTRPITAQTPAAADPALAAPAQTALLGADETGARVSVRYQTGGGMGYGQSYSALDAFLPLLRTGPGFAFADLRGIMTNDKRFVGDVGVGYRFLNADRTRILGVNGYYDYRDTGSAAFNQVGLGIESLGEVFDFRSNAYLPFGQQQQVTSETYTGVAGFQNYNVLLARTRQIQVAPRMIDAEVGMLVAPVADVRAYVGGYYFDGAYGASAGGVRARVQALLTRSLSANAMYTYDRIFGSQVVFSGSVTFPGFAFERGQRRTATDRLVDPVFRNDNITVAERTVNDTEKALYKGTNAAIDIVWVDNTVGAGGDGTFEKPLDTLSQADDRFLASGIRQRLNFLRPAIVFVKYGDGTARNQSEGFLLRANQRLLGEGATHQLAAQQGTFTFWNGDPSRRATISNVNGPAGDALAGNAVVMAEGSEVAGLRVGGAKASGVVAFRDLSGNPEYAGRNFLVQRNDIVGNTAAGVAILDGSVNIGFSEADATIKGVSFEGIDLSAPTVAGRGGLAGQTLVPTVANPIVAGNVVENLVSRNAASGVAVAQSSNSVGAPQTVNILRNTITFNGKVIGEGQGSGVEVQTARDGRLDLNIVGNIIKDNFRRGVNSVGNPLAFQAGFRDNSVVNYNIVSNAIDTNGGDGIGLFLDFPTGVPGAGKYAVNIDGNQLRGNGRTTEGVVAFAARSVVVTGASDSTVAVRLTNNLIAAPQSNKPGTVTNVATGAILFARDSTTYSSVVSGNTFQDIPGVALLVNSGSGAGITRHTSEVTGNLFERIGSVGIDLTAQNGSLSQFKVDGNTLRGTLFGVRMQGFGTAQLTVNVVGNTIDNVTDFQGVGYFGNDTAIAKLTVSGNTITNVGQSGVLIQSTGGATQTTGIVQGNTISGTGTGGGVRVVLFGDIAPSAAALASVEVRNNNISNVGTAGAADAIIIASVTNSRISAVVDGNKVDGASRFGTILFVDGTSELIADLSNNTYANMPATVVPPFANPRTIGVFGNDTGYIGFSASGNVVPTGIGASKVPTATIEFLNSSTNVVAEQVPGGSVTGVPAYTRPRATPALPATP